jgi:hypothetical protein
MNHDLGDRFAADPEIERTAQMDLQFGIARKGRQRRNRDHRALADRQAWSCVWRIADSGEISNSPHTGYESGVLKVKKEIPDENSVRPLAEFHGNPRYNGDLHRADMAWASHAASRGLREQEIRDEILRARDLSKKGRLQRQVSYAERTATKALRTVESSH